jgi:hypothetical protein
MHLKNRKILLFHDQIFKGYYRVCRMNRMIQKKKENDQTLFTPGLTTKNADAGDFGTGISSFFRGLGYRTESFIDAGEEQ